MVLIDTLRCSKVSYCTVKEDSTTLVTAHLLYIVRTVRKQTVTIKVEVTNKFLTFNI